eukprot:Gb_07385 [translate_table: standard]
MADKYSNRDSLFENEEEELRGHAQVWKYVLAFVDSMAVRCAVLLGIPDMISREGHHATLSLSEISEKLPTKSPDVGCLFRLLRFLVSKNVFSAKSVVRADNGICETRYGLTPVSKWLVTESRDVNLVPMFLMINQTNLAPWYCFNECILNGGITAFERANGAEPWSFAASHPEYSKIFNDNMACNTKISMKALLSNYDGFQSLNSLVDVGGGTGTAAEEIVRAYPHIKAISYDLPHVVATAPSRPGVEYVGGDMFAGVPSADAVFLKWIMHDWNDEDCIRILNQCRNAIPETGKVIIVDAVIAEESDEKENGILRETKLVLDLVMVTNTIGGKERTEAEWKRVLCGAGFGRYNIISIQALHSVIEAFPSESTIY